MVEFFLIWKGQEIAKLQLRRYDSEERTKDNCNFFFMFLTDLRTFSFIINTFDRFTMSNSYSLQPHRKRIEPVRSLLLIKNTLENKRLR